MSSEPDYRADLEREDQAGGEATTDPIGDPAATEINEAGSDGVGTDPTGRGVGGDAPARGVVDSETEDPPEPSEPG